MRMSVTTTSGSIGLDGLGELAPVLAGRDQIDARVGVEQVPECLAHEVAVVGDDDAQQRAVRSARLRFRAAGWREPVPHEAHYLRLGGARQAQDVAGPGRVDTRPDGSVRTPRSPPARTLAGPRGAGMLMAHDAGHSA